VSEEPEKKPRAARARKKTAEAAPAEISAAETPAIAEAIAPEEPTTKRKARPGDAQTPAPIQGDARAGDAQTPSPARGEGGEGAPQKPVTLKKATSKRREKSADPLTVAAFSGEGKEAGEVHLSERIFGQEPNQAVMHQALVRQLANARQGSASTKTRGLVSGGGRKPFRQKGLGRSRHGSEREPSMVGGGVVFGPHPRSFAQEMPRKMRRNALRSALSVKARDGLVSVVDGFGLEEPKTRAMVELLQGIGVEGTALLVLAASNDVVARSAANLPWAKTILASNLNLHDLFTYEHLVIQKDALEQLEATFA